MYKYILLVFLIAIKGFSEDFVISEIFANPKGSSSNQGKSWLELSVVGAPRIVHHLKVTIYRSKGSEPEIIVEKTLSEKILFEDKLLLAEDKNLGSKQCLRSQVPLIKIKPLKLKNAKWQKICIALNHQETCAVIGSLNKFADGVSLYRSPTDLSLQPIWLHEPCYLGEGIFASPGLEGRFCALGSVQIFGECPKKGGELKSFTIASGAAAKIIEGRRDQSEVIFRLNGDDRHNPMRTSFCVSLKPQSKLCHELAVVRSFAAGPEYRLAVTTWPKAMGSFLALEVRDLAGKSDRIILSKS